MSVKQIPGSTALRACTCKNDFQDERHGVGKRVHNVTKEGTSGRCGVCLTVRPL